MVRITFVSADGSANVVNAEPGPSLMEVAVANGVSGIVAECGGNCYCGTCRVSIADRWTTAVGAPTEFEKPVIEAADDPAPSLRLSCQIRITPDLDGLTVHLPESQY